MTGKAGTPGRHRDYRWMARTAVAATGMSIVLAVALAVAGRPGGAAFAPAPPWPPWFFHAHPAPALWSAALWLAELGGAAGLALGLAAVRRGWRPRARKLIAGSVVAVCALALVPPVDNGDPVMYAAFGRITVLGHSPYSMTPGQLRAAGDPVGAVVSRDYWPLPSRYGPVATVTEAAASELAGVSVGRAIFWMKLWNALAYLALVLALDRIVRSDAARRARAHLLWSLNPLMLIALMANGHNDVLPAAAGATALFALRRVTSRRALLAGLLTGLAAAIKAQYALFGAGLAWAARRSPRALAALILGAAAIGVPAYLVAGRAAISATAGLTGVSPVGPWSAVAAALGWQHAMTRVNALGLITSGALAAVLLWRLPPGPRDLPAVRVALALALGLLALSPIQTAWYDAMIFPLLAVMPASRLDWIAVARAAALAAASQPFLLGSDPAWLATIERVTVLGTPTVALTAICLALLWLCFARSWNPAGDQRIILGGQSDAIGAS
jgi:Glycosyltransferase family 87